MWPLLIAQASKKYSASPIQIGVNSEGSTESQPDDLLIDGRSASESSLDVE